MKTGPVVLLSCKHQTSDSAGEKRVLCLGHCSFLPSPHSWLPSRPRSAETATYSQAACAFPVLGREERSRGWRRHFLVSNMSIRPHTRTQKGSHTVLRHQPGLPTAASQDTAARPAAADPRIPASHRGQQVAVQHRGTPRSSAGRRCPPPPPRGCAAAPPLPPLRAPTGRAGLRARQRAPPLRQRWQRRGVWSREVSAGNGPAWRAGVLRLRV